MNAQGQMLVWGSLALAVIAIVLGYTMTPAPWAKALLAIGIVAGLAWICFIVWLANAMNTDI